MFRNQALQAMFLVLALSANVIAQGLSKMYWSDRVANTIRRANLDGSEIQTLVSGLGEARGVAVDLVNHRLYWADNGHDVIQRSMLDGTQVETLVDEGLRFPAGITLDVDQNKMYWADALAGRIQRANLDGTQVEDLITGLGNPYYVTLDLQNNHLYWTDYGTDKIQRSDLDGQNVTDLVTTGLFLPRGIALDVANQMMYWADRQVDVVQRSKLDGSGIETLHHASPSSAAPHGVALDLSADQLYWVDNGLVTIKRSNLDGTDVVTLLDGSNENLKKPWQIVLDVRGEPSGHNPLDDISQAIAEGQMASQHDVNQDGVVDAQDREFMITYVLNSRMGDADLNGRFTNEDFVTVFKAGEYEDTLQANSTWETGDWNGDLEFDSEDVVAAFIAGTYDVASPTPATGIVPEPSALGLALVGWLAILQCQRRLHCSSASGSRINR